MVHADDNVTKRAAFRCPGRRLATESAEDSIQLGIDGATQLARVDHLTGLEQGCALFGCKDVSIEQALQRRLGPIMLTTRAADARW